jgi:hypothetical protein
MVNAAAIEMINNIKVCAVGKQIKRAAPVTKQLF